MKLSKAFTVYRRTVGTLIFLFKALIAHIGRIVWASLRAWKKKENKVRKKNSGMFHQLAERTSSIPLLPNLAKLAFPIDVINSPKFGAGVLRV
jgi:hypothetical protein